MKRPISPKDPTLLVELSLRLASQPLSIKSLPPRGSTSSPPQPVDSHLREVPSESSRVRRNRCSWQNDPPSPAVLRPSCAPRRGADRLNREHTAPETEDEDRGGESRREAAAVTTGAAIERVGRWSASSGVGTRRKRERDRRGRGLGGVGRRTPLSDGQCTVRGSRQSGGCRRAAAAAAPLHVHASPALSVLHVTLYPRTSPHFSSPSCSAASRRRSPPLCPPILLLFQLPSFHSLSLSRGVYFATSSLCLLALSVRLPLFAALAAATLDLDPFFPGN